MSTAGPSRGQRAPPCGLGTGAGRLRVHALCSTLLEREVGISLPGAPAASLGSQDEALLHSGGEQGGLGQEGGAVGCPEPLPGLLWGLGSVWLMPRD